MESSLVIRLLFIIYPIKFGTGTPKIRDSLPVSVLMQVCRHMRHCVEAAAYLMISEIGKLSRILEKKKGSVSVLCLPV